MGEESISEEDASLMGDVTVPIRGRLELDVSKTSNSQTKPTNIMRRLTRRVTTAGSRFNDMVGFTIGGWTEKHESSINA